MSRLAWAVIDFWYTVVLIVVDKSQEPTEQDRLMKGMYK